MKVTDLIKELNLNKVDQLLTVKAGFGISSWGFSGGFFSGFEADNDTFFGFTWTDGDNSSFSDNY